MKKWLQDNLMSSLSLGAIVIAAVYFGKVQGLLHTSESIVTQAEDYIIWADENKDKAIGEYILDSIEEVDTKAYRMEQAIKDTIYTQKLESIDSLLRLNVRISSEGKNAAEGAQEAAENVH